MSGTENKDAEQPKAEGVAQSTEVAAKTIAGVDVDSSGHGDAEKGPPEGTPDPEFSANSGKQGWQTFEGFARLWSRIQWLTLLNLAMLLVTGAGVLITFYELRSLNEGNGLTRQAIGQTAEALDLTKESLAATQESNRIAAQSAAAAEKQVVIGEGQMAAANNAVLQAIESDRLSRRAWVSVRAALITSGWPIPPSVNPALTVEFHNTGQTPALDMKASTMILVGVGDLPDGEAFPFKVIEDATKRSGFHRSQILISPGAPFVSSAISQVVTTAEDHAEVVSGRRFWAIVGFVDYEDVFRRTHRTTFCFRTIPRQGNPNLTGCNKWNSGS